MGERERDRERKRIRGLSKQNIQAQKSAADWLQMNRAGSVQGQRREPLLLLLPYKLKDLSLHCCSLLLTLPSYLKINVLFFKL